MFITDFEKTVNGQPFFKNKILPVSDIKEIQNISDLVSKVLTGWAALFLAGKSDIIIIDTAKGIKRTVEEPSSEAVVRGPRVGFTESLSDNTAILRGLGENSHLFLTKFQVGKTSKKELVIAYIDGIANPEIVEEVKDRIQRINIDYVPESGPLSLAKIESQIHSGSSFLVQNIIGTDGEMEFSGAGVINGKTNKLKGFLSEEEVEGITWLSGKGKGGVVKIHDNKTGQIIIYEAKSMKSKITPHVVNGKITSFDVMIKTDGRITENWNGYDHTDENKYRKSAKKALEEVKRLIKNTLGKMQGEFHVDAAGFGTQMRIKYPRVWEKVKKDWDQTFSEVPVHCKVELLITDYGGSKIN